MCSFARDFSLCLFRPIVFDGFGRGGETDLVEAGTEARVTSGVGRLISIALPSVTGVGWTEFGLSADSAAEAFDSSVVAGIGDRSRAFPAPSLLQFPFAHLPQVARLSSRAHRRAHHRLPVLARG